MSELRLRRARRAELGEIRRQMSSATKSRVEDEINRAFKHNPQLLPEMLRRSTAGIANLQGAVENALDELKSDGTLSEDTCYFLYEVFGTQIDSPATMLRVWFPRISQRATADQGAKEGRSHALEEDAQ